MVFITATESTEVSEVGLGLPQLDRLWVSALPHESSSSFELLTPLQF